MITQTVDLRYRLHFRTAWHCGSGLPRGLTDRAIVLDNANRPYVPGSTFKGLVREQCERLWGPLSETKPSSPPPAALAGIDGTLAPDRAGPLHDLFGSAWQPGGLTFDAATMDGPPTDDQAMSRLLVSTRGQVSLSRRTGRAAEGLLYSIESAWSGMVLSGCVRGRVRGESLEDLAGVALTDSLVLLAAGLRSVERVGGSRSAGHGAVEVTLEQATVEGEVTDGATLIDTWFSDDCLAALTMTRGAR